MRQLLNPDRRIFHAGDWITVRLETDGAPGTAKFRTNLGCAAIRRRELIAETESQTPPAGRDWRDYPMRQLDERTYELAMPLAEVGVFLGKCCFFPAGAERPVWPGSGDFHIKVDPAETVAGNLIYCAFTRQFRPDPSPDAGAAVDLDALDRAGYTVIPPSGTFRELAAKLDFILGELGCRILQLLPIHPTPTTYARMGRFGSPFAATDYFAVDPALAEFDAAATPLEQFRELVAAVHARGGRIFLDIPVNHTGWGSRLQLEHPEFFVRRPDGTFESPGAWGVTWADLCKLDYTRDGVFELMARVFLHWCKQGVDGFRCDAGYMIPAPAWRYLTARVRAEFPDTVFLLEGLGGLQSVQDRLLADEGLNWAYSELFQNYTRDQISACQPVIARTSSQCGLLVNFAETHDNTRLAATSPLYARMRCALCALLAENGAFGFTAGVEFYATERIDVHGAPPLNWGAAFNQVAELRTLNLLLANHPAFQAPSTVRLIQIDGGNLVLALRTAPGAEPVLGAVNLDTEHRATATWRAADFNVSGKLTDLLTGHEIEVKIHGDERKIELEPGGALALCQVPFAPRRNGEPVRSVRQRAAAMAAAVWQAFRAPGDCDAAAGESWADELLTDPRQFLRRAAGTDFAPAVRCRLPLDDRRELPVPPASVLAVTAATPFRAEIRDNSDAVRARVKSLPGTEPFALIPLHALEPGDYTIHFELYDSGRTRAGVCHLRRLEAVAESSRCAFARSELTIRHFAFAANDRGGMTQTRGRWGELFSKYDCLLAANTAAEFPADRRILFTRCRGWVVVNDYSCPLDFTTLETFAGAPDNRAVWTFLVPAGQGRRVPLEIELAAAFDRDAIRLIFRRPAAAAGDDGALDDGDRIRVILRPDLESRTNHELTRAFTGPENHFRHSTHFEPSALTFSPGGPALRLELPGARLVPQMEWTYMVHLPFEERYGQDHATDLFSPGYFEFELSGGDAKTLSASAGNAADAQWPDTGNALQAILPLPAALQAGLRPFVVRRDGWKTVIAGYPWFLDWGRDTFIALRGLIVAGYTRAARDILRKFAGFERQGTIPNVIHGADTGNRDTSDAPLWLIRVVAEYIEHTGDRDILTADCGGRTLRSVLESIRDHYISGTPNGIRMNPETHLIYSPAHFTWMDTNYPAATPRDGYPIEIQALWFAALTFLGDVAEARRVRDSIVEKFRLPGKPYLSDCLHGWAGVPDDHLRPNQLFALTLGAVTDPELRREILDATSVLLVPGAIRTLDADRVAYPLPVVRDGHALNDPERPYRGRYEGPEDTARKVAYHNGTAWCWPFPSWAEAYFQTVGEPGRAWALSLLGSVKRYLEDGAAGELPEVADGDWPHTPGGCGAQAWSVSETYRVWRLLTAGANE